MRKLLLVLTIIVSSLLVLPAYAQYGYGTSSITLNYTNAAVGPSAQVYVHYTVNLASGSTWGTTISVLNSSTLSSNGISVSISNQSGNPPFSGTATIGTSSAATPGTYKIAFIATGDDPSSNATVFTLTVLSSPTSSSTTVPSNSTTTSVVTSIPSSGTTITTTSAYYYPPSSQQSNTPLYLSILAVIVLFAVIIAALKWA